MRLAIIDLGTNSARLDIHQIAAGGNTRLLHREKLMVRLGEGLFMNGFLTPLAQRRTFNALTHFHEVSRRLHADRVIAFGTSALREAKNRDPFLARVKKDLGLEVRVISGFEEARLIAEGILSNERTPQGGFGLIDIGGGSTELNFCRSKEVVSGLSLRLGVARLQQVFLKTSPPTPEAVKALRKYIRDILVTEPTLSKWPNISTFVGSSGTIKAVGKMIGKNKIIEKKKLRELVKKMCNMDQADLLKVPGMESRRVDLILGGAILLDEIVDWFGAKRIRITEYALRDGILEEELSAVRTRKTSSLHLHLPDLIQKASAFGLDLTHLDHLASLSAELFDKCQSVHKLKPYWKTHLVAASVLRNTGKYLAYSNHEQHGAYIAQNIEVPGLSKPDAELIAQLCRFHNQSDDKIKKPALNSQSRRKVFFPLLALLRIIEAIDIGPQTRSTIQKVKLTKKVVTLQLRVRPKTGLESLRLERRSKLFQKVFKRKITIAE